jgi:hypothetical protein
VIESFKLLCDFSLEHSDPPSVLIVS